MGVLGSTLTAFSTVIASNAAGVSFARGLGLGLVLPGACRVVTLASATRYAARVRADPTRLLVRDRKAANKVRVLKGTPAKAASFTRPHQIVLLLFALTFGGMIWGMPMGGW